MFCLNSGPRASRDEWEGKGPLAMSPLPLLAASCANLRKVLREFSFPASHSDRKARGGFPPPHLQSRGGLLQGWGPGAGPQVLPKYG